MTGDSRRIPVGDRHLWAERLGRSDQRTVLLLAGAALQATMWEEQFVSILQRADRAVIRFDWRDIGQSSWGRFRDQPYSIDDLTADTFDEPPGFREWLAPLPEGVRMRKSIGRSPAAVVAFSKRRAALQRRVEEAAPAIFPDGSSGSAGRRSPPTCRRTSPRTSSGRSPFRSDSSTRRSARSARSGPDFGSSGGRNFVRSLIEAGRPRRRRGAGRHPPWARSESGCRAAATGAWTAQCVSIEPVGAGG